jgi:hypothetical protein
MVNLSLAIRELKRERNNTQARLISIDHCDLNSSPSEWRARREKRK